MKPLLPTEALKSLRLPFTPAQKQLDVAYKLSDYPRAGLFSEVGTGKTFMATLIARIWGGRNYIAMPPILIDQWAKWLVEVGFSEDQIGVYRGPKRQASLLTKDWVLMSHAIFRDSRDLIKESFDQTQDNLLIDECFVDGTLISTPTGSKPIESLAVGDKVNHSFGVGSVQKVFCRVSSAIYRLEFSDGTDLTCTASHPIFSDLGWYAAKDMLGRRAVHGSPVRPLRKALRKAKSHFVVGGKKQSRNWSDLLSCLWSEAPSGSKPRVIRRSRKQESGASCGRGLRSRLKTEALISGAPGTGVRYIEGYRAQTSSSWRKRSRTYSRRAKDFSVNDSSWFQMELRGSNREGAGAPDALQTGLCTPRKESLRGSGRPEPQVFEGCRERRTERAKTPGTWVECVQVTKLADRQRVWNISVSGCPHYFANGLLVHNCHAAKNPQSVLYKAVSSTIGAEGKLLMMTGTPTSKPSDAYAYIKLKTPRIYRSFGHFENLHVADRDFFGTVTQWRDLDQIAENLALYSVKLTKEDIFGKGTPPMVTPFYYRLSDKHYKLYTKLAEEQLLLLGNGDKIDATTSQRLYHALQQIIVNLDFYSGDPDARSTAYDVIDQYIESIDAIGSGSKAIIWTYYQKTSQSLVAYLKNRYGDASVACAFGGVDSQKGVDAIMSDDRARIFVGVPRSCGAGLNLQYVAHTELFIETPIIPLEATQAMGRIDRPGQTKVCDIKFGTAENTVQVKLFNDLLKKDDLVGRVEMNQKTLRAAIFGGA